MAITAPVWASEETCQRLADAARSWLGTPFRHRAAVRGAGVDCVRLVGEIFRESEFVADYIFPPYSLDYSKHQARSLIREFLDAHPLFTLLWERQIPRGRLEQERASDADLLVLLEEQPARAGDVVCFVVGRTEHHAGVMVNGLEFVHAINPAGVVLGRLDDSTFSKRLSCVYRPLAVPRSNISNL